MWDSSVEFNTESDLINVEKDTKESGAEELNDHQYRQFVDQTYSVIHKVEEIGLPKRGEQIRLVTFRSFNAAVFLTHICEKETIEELLIVVYSINYEAAAMIDNLIKQGKIKKVTVLMSNLRNKAHRKKEQLTRDLFVDNPNIDLFFASAHSKIMSMKTSSGEHYSLEGSGNLSFNSRIEQYVLDNNKELFDFTKNWMQDIKKYLKGKKELVLT